MKQAPGCINLRQVNQSHAGRIDARDPQRAAGGTPAPRVHGSVGLLGNATVVNSRVINALLIESIFRCIKSFDGGRFGFLAREWSSHAETLSGDPAPSEALLEAEARA